MSEFKVIIQGRLEFTNQSSYEKALRMYEHRIENFYKSDLFISEDIFNEEEYSLIIPRIVSQGTTKFWTNTVKLLEYLAQFAVSGWVGAWQVESGVILKYAEIEPKGDKAVIKNFIRGRALAEEDGKAGEAIKLLNKAIEQYDKHAWAYGWRGYVNYLLGNYKDALHDFEKSLNLDPGIPNAYFWRAKVHAHNKDWDNAIADFETTTRKAIALQPIYWKARKLKAECHIQKQEWTLAEKELRLFLARKFPKGDTNARLRLHASYQYAKVLLELKKYDDAIEVIDKALLMKEGDPDVNKHELLTLRGIIKQESGASAQSDWKEAAKLGSSMAEELLSKHYAG